MLEPSTLHFLRNLSKNNNKNWFDENRSAYETAKSNFGHLVGELIHKIGAFDEPIGHLKTSDCTFRINRDVRFSKDKRPYKSNLAASFSAGGKKALVAGYYFHLEPGQSFAGGGYYTPMPPELAKIRQEIDYNFEEWKQIISNKSFKKRFPGSLESEGSLVRPPKGYDEENPAIRFLKMKSFIVTHPFTDIEIAGKRVVQEITETFKAMKPMIDFLNRAIE
jgi:uncharacterized protein (TIGR02453 family)